MKTEKRLGIWMDHANAYLMEPTGQAVAKIITSLSTHEEKEKTLQKGESMMHNKEQQQQAEYYEAIGEYIKDYDRVLLFGPTNAKVELSNSLAAQRAFSEINIVVKQADKMTENQKHAFVKKYFSKY